MTEEPMAGGSDDALLEALGRGDQQAMSVLHRRHAGVVTRLLRRLTGDPQVAEELAQDTFVALWTQHDTFRGESSLRSWLLGIARRQARDRLRSRSRAVAVAEVDLDLVPDSDAGPEERALASADVERVAAAVRALPGPLRETLELVVGAGLSQAQVAARLGVPEGTIKSRIYHARRRLTEALADESPPGGGGR